MSVDVGSAVGYLDLDISGFLTQLQHAQAQADTQTQNMGKSITKNMTSIGGKLTSAGKTLMLGVTAPLVAAGAAALKFSTDYDYAMKQISTIADPAAKSIGAIKTEITALSNETGIAASELASATYQAISSGVDTAAAVEFVGQASKLAAGGFTTATQAVDVLTTVINAYGLEAKDATHISDVLIKTQNLGKTTVDELSASIGKVIPTANAYGVSIEELGTAYSFMTSQGIATAESTTYLNSMISELGKEGTTVASTLKDKTGKSFTELMDSGMSLGDVLGILKDTAAENGIEFANMWQSQEAAKAGLSLTNKTTQEYNDTLKDFNNTVGDTDAAFEKMQESLKSKVNIAFNAFKNVAIKLGDALSRVLVPIIEKLTDWLIKLGEWFDTLTESQQETIVKMLMLAAAIPVLMFGLGTIMTTIPKIITVFGGLKTAIGVIPGALSAVKVAFINFGEAMALNAAGYSAMAGQASGLFKVFSLLSGTLGIVLIAVAVLGAAFATLWNTSEEFRNSIGLIFSEMTNAWNEFQSNFVAKVNELGFNFTSIVDILKAVWFGFCDILAPIFVGAFAIISNAFQAALDIILGLLDFFIGIFTGDWDQMMSGISQVWGALWTGLVNFITIAFQTIFNVTNVFLGFFGTSWEQLWTNVSTFFMNTWTGITTFFSTIGETIGNFASSTVDNVVAFFAQLPEKTTEFFSQLPYLIGFFLANTLISVALWVLEMGLKAYEVGSNFITAITTFFSQLPTNVGNFLMQTISNVVAWVGQMTSNAQQAGSNFITNVINFIQTLPSRVQSFLSAALNNVISWAGGLASAGAHAASSLVNAVVSGVAGLPGQMASVGASIVEGVWSGIEGAIGWFTSSVNSFFAGIVGGAQSALGINSPSKVFADIVGTGIVEGTWKGVKDNWTWFIDNVKNTFAGIQQAVGVQKIDVELGTKVSSDVQTTIDSLGVKFGIVDSINYAIGGLFSKMDQLSKTLSNGVSINYGSFVNKQQMAIQLVLADGRAIAEYVIDDVGSLLGEKNRINERGGAVT